MSNPGNQVNAQLVIQILTDKIAGLTIENAALQARVISLESELQKAKQPSEKSAKSAEKA